MSASGAAGFFDDVGDGLDLFESLWIEFFACVFLDFDDDVDGINAVEVQVVDDVRRRGNCILFKVE
jgi:hypothetical protein